MGAAREAGSPPPVEEVRPGLWSLPVPIPSSPLPHVLCYAFEVSGGVVLVDPGWYAPESQAALEAGPGRRGADPRPLRGRGRAAGADRYVAAGRRRARVRGRGAAGREHADAPLRGRGPA